MVFKALDLDGKRFGMLIATNQLKKRQYPSRGQALRLCHCDCGHEAWVTTGRLRSGHTVSCGCNKGTKLKPGRAARNQILDSYKRGAIKRGLAWKLSDEFFDDLTSQACHYCGRKPNLKRMTRGNNGFFTYNGIDRLDNLLGYDTNNVVPCCVICNRAKRDMSASDFICWLDDVVKYRYEPSYDQEYME